MKPRTLAVQLAPPGETALAAQRRSLGVAGHRGIRRTTRHLVPTLRTVVGGPLEVSVVIFIPPAPRASETRLD